MKGFDQFNSKFTRSLNNMEHQISLVSAGVKGLSEGFHEFKEDLTDFMAFTAETYSDHEKRISELEKKIS